MTGLPGELTELTRELLVFEWQTWLYLTAK